MAVPALGAATPIVVPPEREQLVEGHTVFTVIEIARARNTTETNFAAAVAVLVREYNAQYRFTRFPGVLWFNDQYLVNPSQSARNEAALRYPCGGAVMAVNAGDPDPRMTVAQDEGALWQTLNDPTVQAATFGIVDPSLHPLNQLPGGDDGTAAGEGASWGTDEYAGYTYGNDYSLVGIDESSQPYTTGADYLKSYLITDPNDHSWIIDVYTAYTTDTVVAQVDTDDPTQSVLVTTQTDEFFVWVVNINGGAAFVPDDNESDCPPIQDLDPFCTEGATLRPEPINPLCNPLNNVPVEAEGQNRADTSQTGTLTCNSVVVDPDTDGDADPSTGPGVVRRDVEGTPAFPGLAQEDDPCAGYQDPGSSGFCYQGKAGASTAVCDTYEPRKYNALLYFELGDLDVAGVCKDHDTGSWNGDPTCGAATWQNAAGQTGVTDQTGNGATETNGCHNSGSMAYTCPAGGDNMEGNSHPFHPVAHPMGDVEPCQGYIGGPNAYNHGGSAYSDAFYGVGGGRGNDPDSPNGDPVGWTPCDNFHATRDIDVYFSGAGRPLPPIQRRFVELDTEGSGAPFYQGTH